MQQVNQNNHMCAMTIIDKPIIIQDTNEKCTPTMIVLYLPVFISASKPKSGYERNIRHNVILKKIY